MQRKSENFEMHSVKTFSILEDDNILIVVKNIYKNPVTNIILNDKILNGSL